jgi:hypothetical protein
VRAGGRAARVASYLAAALLLLLALGSKSMAVTVPLLFLAIDWHAGRPLGIRVLLEKLPLLALSIVFGLLNVMAQHPDIHADSFNAGLGLPERLELALRALAFYVGRSVLPFGLSGYYEVGFAEVGALTWLVAAASTVLVLAVTIRHAELRRDAALGAALFLIPLALVLRIIPFGGFSGWQDRYLSERRPGRARCACRRSRSRLRDSRCSRRSRTSAPRCGGTRRASGATCCRRFPGARLPT